MSTLSKSFVALALAAACALPGGGRDARRQPAKPALPTPIESQAESSASSDPALPGGDHAGPVADPALLRARARPAEHAAGFAPGHAADPSPTGAAVEAASAGSEGTAVDPGTGGDERGSSAEIVAEPSERSPWLRIDRGAGQVPLFVPHAEELVFRVIIDVGILGDVEAGRVVLSSGVERYVSGLPPAGSTAPKKPELEMGWIKSFATGGYSGYRLEQELRARILPQVWPRIFYTDTQTGSENRRRELKIGLVDGRPSAWYRNDGHCRGCDNREHFIESPWIWGDPEHCKKCKRAEHRVWKTPTTRGVPTETVDMLSAVYLARSMVRDGIEETAFPLVDKQKLWHVRLRTGRRKKIATPAGTFDAREVRLATSRPPAEPVDADDKGFEGMFGIRGTIQIWLDAGTGVPVRIEGELPVPVLGDLHVRVELKQYRGTPDRFEPVQ